MLLNLWRNKCCLWELIPLYLGILNHSTEIIENKIKCSTSKLKAWSWHLCFCPKCCPSVPQSAWAFLRFMLVGIWTTGSHLEMPVVLIFFSFILIHCQLLRMALVLLRSSTQSDCFVYIFEFQKQKAREAVVRTSMCVHIQVFSTNGRCVLFPQPVWKLCLRFLRTLTWYLLKTSQMEAIECSRQFIDFPCPLETQDF